MLNLKIWGPLFFMKLYKFLPSHLLHWVRSLLQVSSNAQIDNIQTCDLYDARYYDLILNYISFSKAARKQILDYMTRFCQ
jgi:hypothetical protein